MTRTAAEVGEGLAPVRAARAIRRGERVHILGIAGAGASAAALHAHAQGAIVSGCDPGGPSPYTPAVEAAGIQIAWSHDAAHVATDPPPDRLAVTKALTAIDPHNPELAAAVARGIAVEGWQQLIADAAFGRTLVAVAGTHGKSTTAGWLTWVLAEAGLDPSAFVGALLPASLSGGIPATARIGQGSAFIVEADEYAGNFDAYRPDVALLTSVEWDHPDVFADQAAVEAAFDAWLQRVPAATLVANVANAGVVEVVIRLVRRPGRVIGVGVEDASLGWQGAAGSPRPDPSIDGDHYIAGVASVAPGARTSLYMYDYEADWDTAAGRPDPHGDSISAELQLAGLHNAANAALVTGTAVALRVRPEIIVRGLASFPGIGRRLERKGEARGVVVYDDYGHHPTAIRATIGALRQREPQRHLWAVYEPLTFHRTAAMLDDFASALAEADAVAVADIWASRDPDTTITSSAALAEATKSKRSSLKDRVGSLRRGFVAEAPGSVEQTAAWLAANIRNGDAVLVMGGGKSYRIAELLLENLESS